MLLRMFEDTTQRMQPKYRLCIVFNKVANKFILFGEPGRLGPVTNK